MKCKHNWRYAKSVDVACKFEETKWIILNALNQIAADGIKCRADMYYCTKCLKEKVQ